MALAGGGGTALALPQTEKTGAAVFVPPTARSSTGRTRLKVRDAFNEDEIDILNMIHRYDKKRNGQIEHDKFRSLLQEREGGDTPSEDELRQLLRGCCMNPDSTVSEHEAMMVLKAWHGYKNLPDKALKSIDTLTSKNPDGKIDAVQLQPFLCERLNDGMKVTKQEVDFVLRCGGKFCEAEGRIGKDELAFACSAWYMNVERRKTPKNELASRVILRAFTPSVGLAVLGNKGMRAPGCCRITLVASTYVIGIGVQVFMLLVPVLEGLGGDCPAPLGLISMVGGVIGCGIFSIIFYMQCKFRKAFAEGRMHPPTKCKYGVCCMVILQMLVLAFGLLLTLGAKDSKLKCGKNAPLLWEVSFVIFLFVPLATLEVIACIYCGHGCYVKYLARTDSGLAEASSASIPPEQQQMVAV